MLKPEGTQSKCYDSLEGMHKPLGRYIFNNVAFSKYDPLVETLRAANYNVFNHPYDDSATLVTFPVKNDGVEFTEVDGKEINTDSAISQLNAYKMLMENYCHQNVSCTISYSIDETDEIVDWLYNNWDSYVAVSFLFRNDPSKTAKDLGYPYLPQEVVTKDEYDSYVRDLLPVQLGAQEPQSPAKEVTVSSKVDPAPIEGQDTDVFYEIKDQDCATGSCPIR